jgi:hypothetical protein
MLADVVAPHVELSDSIQTLTSRDWGKCKAEDGSL